MMMTVSYSELIDKGNAARDLGASVEIVGGWAWARFNVKPDEDTIGKMKGLGYKWSKAKKRWYFVGAISTAKKRHSWQQICQRYAPIPIEEAMAA